MKNLTFKMFECTLYLKYGSMPLIINFTQIAQKFTYSKKVQLERDRQTASTLKSYCRDIKNLLCHFWQL